jgi:hypothetical protein
VILYHSTHEAGKIGIQTEGFGLSHVEDHPVASWFCAHQDPVIGDGPGWWVIVEVPDDVAAAHQFNAFHFAPCRFQLSDVEFFLIPWDVVNRYRPFRFERHAA